MWRISNNERCFEAGAGGLRILTKIEIGHQNSKVVTKPIVFSQITKYAGYLKSCHLCHNPLSLDKEIYMYRGEFGFCSVECRERQIYLDDTKEIELSTRKIFSSSSFRRSHSSKTRSLVFS